MKDETSIFGAKPERLDRLVFEALQDSEAEEPVPTASLGAVLERLGGQIGHYKLISVLGEGGMGIVYLAEQQEPIRRKVALKVIKPGMDSKRVMARFEAERQALALLDHPNIAHVYDGGTTEAGPTVAAASMALRHGGARHRSRSVSGQARSRARPGP